MPPRRRNQSPDPPNEQNPPRAPPLPNAADLMALMTQFVQAVNAQQAAQAPPPPLASVESVYDRFSRRRPPIFPGTTDDIKAEHWITTIERIFRVVKCNETEKAQCAIDLLRDEAFNWWRGTVSRLGVNEDDITWEIFAKEFRAHYIPKEARKRRAREFMNLEQGNMNVTEYIAEFNLLATYTPHITDDEGRKTEKFIEGLRGELAEALAPVEIEGWATATSLALKVEAEKQRIGSKKVISGSGTSSGSREQPLAHSLNHHMLRRGVLWTTRGKQRRLLRMLKAPSHVNMVVVTHIVGKSVIRSMGSASIVGAPSIGQGIVTSQISRDQVVRLNP